MGSSYYNYFLASKCSYRKETKMTIDNTTLFFGMFYLSLAILLLAIAIIVYPTLKKDSKKK